MKRLWKKKEVKIGKVDRRKFTLFSASLLFSILFWLLFSLSKTYTYQVTAVLKFKNNQVRRGLQLPPFRKVDLTMEGTGWSLLTGSRQPSSIILEADMAGKHGKSFIALRDLLPEFNQQVRATEKIIAIEPDTIRYGYLQRKSKKVPLVFHYAITFARQFYYQDPFIAAPDSILVSGPATKLAQVSHWDAPSLTFLGLNHSVDTLLNLNDHNRPELSTEPSAVHCSFRVDQFTERIMPLAVRPLHALTSDELTLIPANVNVYLLVPLKYYNILRPEQFDLTCDLNEWRLLKHSKLALHLKTAPDFIRVEKIFPPDLDFLLHE